mgnify:CR=1 FL=1
MTKLRHAQVGRSSQGRECVPKCAWTQAPASWHSWLAARSSQVQGQGAGERGHRDREAAFVGAEADWFQVCERCAPCVPDPESLDTSLFSSDAETESEYGETRDGLSLSLDGELFLAGLSLSQSHRRPHVTRSHHAAQSQQPVRTRKRTCVRSCPTHCTHHAAH